MMIIIVQIATRDAAVADLRLSHKCHIEWQAPAGVYKGRLCNLVTTSIIINPTSFVGEIADYLRIASCNERPTA